MAQQTILIVDDDATMAGMFAMMLEGEGYRTVVVHGASMAINTIRAEKPDMVLLDVMMPGVSGIELCSYIRREPDLLSLPIVLISAKSSPEDVQAGLDAGATVYLQKPVSKRELLEGLDQALSGGAPASVDPA